MHNSHRNSGSASVVRFLFLLFILVGCFSLGIGAFFFSNLSKDVETRYGPPNAQLDTLQRWTLTVKLLQSESLLIQPVDPSGQPGDFQVEFGEAVPSVALRLERNGYIPSAEAFVDFLIYSGLDIGIQAGQYQLSPAQSAIEIAAALQDATPAEVAFRILAGWRAEEIAAAFSSSGLNISADAFLQAVYMPPYDALPPQWGDVSSLEGYLFPETYQVPRTTDLQALLDIFLEGFESEVTPDLRTAFTVHDLDLREAILLASIVEREAVLEEEMPMIASVFYNRLAIGMKLESDPTVQYALGYNPDQSTWWTNPLSSEDLIFISPYNTYVSDGLPPGPICNPGFSAIQSVAFPAQTPYLYFRATCDDSGKHNFSKTYEEHLMNACP